jgi:uncharacterized protein YcfJ
MKKLVTIAAVLSMFGSAAFANQVTATVVDMRETYRDVVKQVPVQSCQTIDVPIYKEVVTGGGGASTGDVLAGAIIGGVIGNQFGNGKGKDAMTVLGAIVGADSVNKKGQRETVIVGYRQQQQCSTVYEQQQVSVRGDNVVTVELDNGKQYEFYTKGWYKNGTVVFLNLDLQK